MSLKESPSLVALADSGMESGRNLDVEEKDVYFSELEVLIDELRENRILLKKLEVRIEELESQNEALELNEIEYRQQFENLEISQDEILGDLVKANRTISQQDAMVSILTSTLDSAEQENESFRQTNHTLSSEIEHLKAVAEIKQNLETEAEPCDSSFDQRESPPNDRFDDFLLRLQQVQETVAIMQTFDAELSKTVLDAQKTDSDSFIWPETDQLLESDVIDRLEMLEDLSRQFRKCRVVSDIGDKLEILRNMFVDLLKMNGIDQFELTPGARLTSDEKSKITIIRAEDLDDPKLLKEARYQTSLGRKNVVIRTIRPGYVYRQDRLDITLRKAEVVLNS